MTTTKKTNQIIFSIFLFILSICIACSISIPSLNNKVHALDMASNEVTLTNSDFNSSSSNTLQSTPNGWSKSGSSTGKSGVITINEETFSSRASSYALTTTQNPGKPYTIQSSELDNKILMINAKSSTKTNESNHVGYVSNSFALASYSYYKVSVWTLTQENAVASIYLSGLGDDVLNTSFESYSTNVWTEYRFYIATGLENKNATIELWLGTKTKDSLNAVFFDHITVNKLSNNYFYDEAEKYLEPEYASEAAVRFARLNIVDLRDEKLNLISNPNFENGDFTGWEVVDYLPADADAKIVSINNRASMESLGIDYLGSNYSANNDFALTLYSTSNSKTSVGYKSQSFEVLPYEAYKVSVWAKVSDNFEGNATIYLKEGNDVCNFYGENSIDYTPVSSSINISSNSSDKLTNNYTKYDFYIKGHELFKTSFTLELWLGSEDSKAKGCVVFDDISFEKISWKNYTDGSSTNSKKVDLKVTTGSPSVANGTFNTASELDKNFTYPVKPSDWTHESENEVKSSYGIINTYSTFYEVNKNNYGNAKNPGNPTNSALDVDKDVNNILMLYNSQDTYQAVTSQNLSTTKDSYQKISFDYKTVQQTLNTKLLNVYVLDDENNILFADEDLYSANWTTYSLLIKSNSYTSTLKLKISLGNSENQVSGYLYIDNVKFGKDESMTDELYNQYVVSHKTLDFSVTNFNFISTSTTHDMYTPYRYEQKLEMGENNTSGDPIAYGGIIDGKNNLFGITNSENNNEVLKYMPAFVTAGTSLYTLTSKEKLSLETDKYYKISFDVYTRFSGNTLQEDLEDDEKLKYGAIFSLKGIDKDFGEIVSNDKWTNYTLFVEVSNKTDVNLKFGILNESQEIQGQAFFDGVKFETIEKAVYTQALELAKDDPTIFTVSKAETEEKEDDKEDDKDTNNNFSMIWYIIPSVILFAALVIALLAYSMKNITIKKWERKKASEYDRNSTLHRDVIRRDAEKIRDGKIKELENQIAEVQAEIERIEAIHKENLKQQRRSTNKTITRAIEKDFKSYANRHTKLENHIEMLKGKIDALNMPEYLLGVQRNLTIEKIRKEREEKEKQAKLKKQQAKLDKKSK